MARLCVGAGLVLLFALCGVQAQISQPCQSKTGIPGCIECEGPGNAWYCNLCNVNRAITWGPTGVAGVSKITQCKATTVGAACLATSKDPNCMNCDPTYGWCNRCKLGFAFNDAYKCVAANCQAGTKNPNCAACNPNDGTCTRCTSPGSTPLLVMPISAIYANVPMPQSQCVSAGRLAAEFKNVNGGGTMPALPQGCVEVTPDFKCARCGNGQSLTNGKCVNFGAAGGSGCKAANPFVQYCAKCAAGGATCQTCTWGRSIEGGQCRVNCKVLWGIGCLSCGPDKCLKVDPAYANGRRR